MTPRQNIHPTDWSGIELVVFDVDGTLYDQRALRIRMARDMVFQAFLSRDLSVLSVIRTYRRIRERLGEEEVVNFETLLITQTVASTGCSEEKVLAIVTEWIEQRPLPYLIACRYPDLIELFEGLKRNSKIIGVFSDYPAHAKLAALGLTADFVVSAQDDGIGLLKPHPRGLEFLMTEAGATAATTVLIGDRRERDGLAAQRAGARCLIRSSKPMRDWQTFAHYDDLLFAPLLSS
jgi:FMN phosphatase YigB (HAD superfamily)